ncbi:bifunctional phosphopantothenoylcysteine decarboxylase/phosphopantothenate--cysteine ligase CoaBC, partial [Candidatus Bathyarchaeota archaeon]
ARRGAEVTLVYGPGSVKPPSNVKAIPVETSKEMFESSLSELKAKRYHVFIAAAAMADYTPEKPSQGKIPTSRFPELTVKLKATPKLVDQVKKVSPETFLVSFKAEYGVSEEELERKALEKLKAANADLVVANDVSKPGSGFEKDEIEVLIVGRGGLKLKVSRVSKAEVASKILDLVEEGIRKA